MFPRERRIRTTKEIVTVLRKGNRRSEGQVTCSFIRKPGTLGKVTVIVDTKVSKLAVVRNRLKRHVRAALREIGLPEGELIVRLFRGADALTYQEIKDKIIRCLAKV